MAGSLSAVVAAGGKGGSVAVVETVLEVDSAVVVVVERVTGVDSAAVVEMVQVVDSVVVVE